jgi:protocatechuate 3,4-dioxygenase, beta subunit
MPAMTPQRRQLLLAALGAAGTAAATLALPTQAQTARVKLPAVTEGPFYPPPRWRALQTDWDADLTQVRNKGQTLVALGEHLGLDLRVVDAAGQAVDRVEFEIWQCDVHRTYRHPSERDEERMDKGFQGFGVAHTNAQGVASFRTIKPVAYPGRTPHIHIKLRHASFGELTSQLFLAGDPGNARDGIWRQLGAAGQGALDMTLLPAKDDGLRWRVQHAVVVGS